MKKVPTAIFISGRGSNMVALANAAADPEFPAEIALVLSNDPGAAGLETARARGIATRTVDHRTFSDRTAFEAKIDETLRAANIELICLAGFMRILTAEFVSAWPGRILNIHPSLLPAFKGLGTHARALAAGATKHGASVHFVDAALDSGPVIVQADLAVLPGDTAMTLAARVLEIEHRIYPQALARVASDLRQ